MSSRPEHAPSERRRARPAGATVGRARTTSTGSQPIQYGLIAEEVAEVYPDLVVYGEDGQAETVQYWKLEPMMLNELQKQHAENQEQGARIQEQQAELDALEARLADLEALLPDLTSGGRSSTPPSRGRR